MPGKHSWPQGKGGPNVILSQREEEDVTESEKGDEFHPWVSSQQPWVVLMGFLALADTMENKGCSAGPH